MMPRSLSAAESQLVRDERLLSVERTMERFNFKQDGLMEVLITAQKEYSYLSEDMLTFVAGKLQLPLSQVYGVATFYDNFTLAPSGTIRCSVCTGPACDIAGAGEVLAEACKQAGVSEPGQVSPDGQYSVRESACLGLCDQSPAALVNETAQVNLSLEDVPAMLQAAAQRPTIRVCGEPQVLTSHIGKIEPCDLEAHRAEGAFAALEKALTEMTPEDVIREVKDSRLAGRGGAGFPTGLKWELAQEAPGSSKVVVCNFDESEPGTFKDRALMQGDPFRVIEGLILSAYAIGACEGYIFIRGEYPAATKILQEALDSLHPAGLLGEDILNTGFDFKLEIRHNAGAYICGEETALFEAIEGKRGHPRMKPPYPTQSGLFGKPTVINNVETLASVPSLILHGGKWFTQWGTEKSTGLKLFCLSGHVREPGVVEAPYGLSIRELIERFGGGFVGDPQAVLIGGAAGGFLHPNELDTPLTSEDLKPLDVPIGSGAIMVFNQSVDMWQVLHGLAHFFVHESCGQCAPCRLGTKQIYALLNRINNGAGSDADLHKMEELGRLIRGTSNCGLGMTAANPVLTYLDSFEAQV